MICDHITHYEPIARQTARGQVMTLKELAGGFGVSATPVREALQQMEAHLERPKDCMLANSRFRFAIYARAGSPVLLQLIESLWVRIGPYFVISSNAEQNRHAIRYHREMWGAFALLDARRMRESLGGDLERAAGIIVALLQSADSGRVAGGPAQAGKAVKSRLAVR